MMEWTEWSQMQTYFKHDENSFASCLLYQMPMQFQCFKRVESRRGQNGMLISAGLSTDGTHSTIRSHRRQYVSVVRGDIYPGLSYSQIFCFCESV